MISPEVLSPGAISTSTTGALMTSVAEKAGVATRSGRSRSPERMIFFNVFSELGLSYHFRTISGKKNAGGLWPPAFDSILA
jgi:hypothetical protein